MSDSTIDDALRLLEIGKGNPDRLKQIIESFQKRSMISMQDRKYVDALVEQYLTPRHRQMTSKMKPSDRQKTNFPRIRKTTESSFKITEVKATSENPYIKPRTETKKPEPQKEELASKEPTIEEKFIEHVALQCGICTPGLLIAAKHFLEENPDPTSEEVRYGIAGNLCRCTGYQNIIKNDPILQNAFLQSKDIESKSSSNCRVHYRGHCSIR